MDKQSLFNNHGPLCFVHLFTKSQLTFLQVNRLHVSPPSQTALTHIRSLWGGGEKTKTYDMKCKDAFGRVLKPTIYIYTDMHSLPSVYILYSTHKVFSFVCLSIFYTHLTLKKRNFPLHRIYVILLNKCIKD